MTYIINGTTLDLQPESGEWQNRDTIGTDGNGHPVYSSVREFEMKWGFMSMNQFKEIRDLYNNTGVTGTSVVSLPRYGWSSWEFREYSGTVLHEPRAGQYFEQYVSDVSLLVVKIRTE